MQDTVFDGGIRHDCMERLGLGCSKGFLEILSASLRTEQVVRFYEPEFRDAQPKREPEFRDDFLAAFAAHAGALPPAGATTRRTSRLPRLPW